MRFAIWPLIAMISTLIGLSAIAAPTEMFPWRVADTISPNSAVDLAHLNGDAIGPEDAIRLTPDGQHLMTASGERVFLFGTNMSMNGNFPDTAYASEVADRLARLGFNCIRLHHIDSRFTPTGIFDPDAGDHRHIDPEQMALLDHFAHELWLRGIYVDLNLHVGRTLDDSDGVPDGALGPRFNKGVDLYHPEMIELQQEYARDLLNHVNPHTGRRWADEPGVAIVECTNEDSLLREWSLGNLDDIPDTLLEPLRTSWNAWLLEKYDDDQSLRDAWNVGAHPPGSEMLINSDFEDGFSPWVIEQIGGATATETQFADGGPENSPFMRITTTTLGTERWHIQFKQRGLSLVEGVEYDVTASVRSNDRSEVSLFMSQETDPWGMLGLLGGVPLTESWEEHSWTFTASANENNARLSFGRLGDEVGSVDFAQISLRPAGALGLPDGESISSGNVDLLTKQAYRGRTEACLSDWLAFLWDTEVAYGQTMRTFLTEEIGVSCPIFVSQVNYSPSILQSMSGDVTGHHHYWDHPRFLTVSWDPINWRVHNRRLSSRSGLEGLGGMASVRVEGMPFVVTEFNMGSPNDHGAEAYPLAALMAGLQGWDGLFVYSFSHHSTHITDRINGFFDIAGHPTKLVAANLAARLLRLGHIEASANQLAVPLDRETEATWWVENWWRHRSLARSADPLLALTQGLAVADADSPEWIAPPLTDDPVFQSDTGEIIWDVTDEDLGLVTLNAPTARGVIGSVASGESHDLGGVVITPGLTERNWCVIALTSTDERPIGESNRLVLTAMGMCENTGLEWNEQRTTVGREWGSAPALVEGVPATVRLPIAPERVSVWALDGSGARDHEVLVFGNSQAVFNVGPEDATLWYEIEVTPNAE